MLFISRKKRRHIRHLLTTVRPRIFAPHFFTIEDVWLMERLNRETKTKYLQLSKVIFIGREDFVYFENSIIITMLLVSLVHQFIWPTFTLVFTRIGIFKYNQKPWMRLKLVVASIFIMSDRAAFTGTVRIEANQTSKVELFTCKIASWTVESFKQWNIFAQSSIFDA